MELLIGIILLLFITTLSFIAGQFVGWLICQIYEYVSNKIKNNKRKGE